MFEKDQAVVALRAACAALGGLAGSASAGAVYGAETLVLRSFRAVVALGGGVYDLSAEDESLVMQVSTYWRSAELYREEFKDEIEALGSLIPEEGMFQEILSGGEALLVHADSAKALSRRVLRGEPPLGEELLKGDLEALSSRVQAYIGSGGPVEGLPDYVFEALGEDRKKFS